MSDVATPSLIQSLPCGCKASACDTGWRIEAEAFICPDLHKQGAIVPRDEPDDYDAYLRQAVDR